MAAPWMKYQSTSSTPPWMKYKKETRDPSQLEAGLRGAAQGASFGFEDELTGAAGALGSMLGSSGVDKIESTHPEVQAQIDQLAGPNKSFGDLYTESRDEERLKNEASSKANPGTFLASEIAGGVANPITRAAGTLKGALGVGATQGLGGSQADLTEGDVPGAAVDTALGSGLGAVGYGVGKALPMVARAGGNLTKKALTTLGPSEEAITARLAGKAQPTARSYPELAEDLGGSVKDLRSQISGKSNEAAQKLTAEANIPKEYITTPIDEALSAQGKLIGNTDKQVASSLNSLKQDLSQYGDKLSQKDIKTIIQKLDDNINWDDQSQDKLNRTLEGLRKNFDSSLKFQNPDYKAAMKPISQRMRVLDNIKRQFNLKNIPGEGLQPTDTTATKMQTALRENKAVTQKNLEKLKEFTGKDFQDLAKDFQLSNQFENTGPNGSRRTVLGGAVGGLLGAGAPGAIGLGAGAGAILDRYGGKAVGKLIDSYLAAGNSKAFGKFAPMIEQAAKRSPEALAVTSSLLANNPEFKKMIGMQ